MKLLTFHLCRVSFTCSLPRKSKIEAPYIKYFLIVPLTSHPYKCYVKLICTIHFIFTSMIRVLITVLHGTGFELLINIWWLLPQCNWIIAHFLHAKPMQIMTAVLMQVQHIQHVHSYIYLISFADEDCVFLPF